MQKLSFTLSAICLLLFASCGNNTGNNAGDSAGDYEFSSKRSSSGKTLEILVAANSDVYTGEIKAIVDSLFEQPQVALNQYEPMFDIVNMPKTSLFGSEMFKAHRNILIIDKNVENKNTVYLRDNPWAYPQVVAEVSVTSIAQFREIMPKYFNVIVEKMHNSERIRVMKAFKKMENLDITKKQRENFGFWIPFSNEFQISTIEKDFAWIRKEAKDFGIGIIMRSIPYNGDTTLFRQDRIITLRDNITRKYIPGPTHDSYMTTEKQVNFFSKNVTINNLNGIETRGLWRVENDFMGGPFVNYLLLDSKNQRLIMLDGYVYSPRKPKRDLLMQAEGLIYSLQLL